jgi:hypothetical protein
MKNRKATFHRRNGLGRVNTGGIRVRDLDVGHARMISKVADAIRAQTQLEVLIGRGDLHRGLNTRFLSCSVDHAYYTIVSVRDGTTAELDANKTMSLAERAFQRSTTDTHHLAVDRGQTKAQAIGVSEVVRRYDGARPVGVREHSEPSRSAVTAEGCEPDLIVQIKRSYVVVYDDLLSLVCGESLQLKALRVDDVFVKQGQDSEVSGQEALSFLSPSAMCCTGFVGTPILMSVE